mmetsp:Transcript_20239/g.29615  ORF Transcript_20239/g.29615 Transcript_20239/m.29615 type:complete len:235 (-) Transcript_20239:571-1275(-)
MSAAFRKFRQTSSLSRNQQPTVGQPPKSRSRSGTHLYASTGTASVLSQTSAMAFNISREGYNIQVLATYGTITALVMNACLRLYSSTKFPKNTNTNKQGTKNLEILFFAVTALCIISGTFTAVLFNILGIYSKSALGMQNDNGFLAFMAATKVYRIWGFRAFLTTLSSFVGSFLLSLYSNIMMHEKNSDYSISNSSKLLGKVTWVTSILLTLLGTYHIKKVMNLATAFIFTPEF